MSFFLTVVYLIIMLMWTVTFGVEYYDNRTPKNARRFLVGFVWPIGFLVFVLRLVCRASVDAFRRNK